MKSKIVGIFICMLLIGTALPVLNSLGESVLNDNWYYLPGYSNYAPSGLPDFSQKAQDDWKFKNFYSHCAPTSIADILWWFDSKHESQDGTPGDGIDDYPLVPDFNAPGTPNPGPYSDDHNYNNANDIQTPWKGDNSGELIERLGYYFNTNFVRTPIFSLSNFVGTMPFMIKRGTIKYIKEAGLQNEYEIKHIYFPDFSTITEHINNNEGVALSLLFYSADENNVRPGHIVAVAGVNPDGYIALSDPGYDEINPQLNYSDFNDASIVSHDIWEVDFNPPLYPSLFSLWLPDYGYKDGVFVYWAIIISDIS